MKLPCGRPPQAKQGPLTAAPDRAYFIVMEPKTAFIPSPRQVRAIRAWLGDKQPVFAGKCSVSHSALGDYELSKRHSSPETLMAIARYVATVKEIKFDALGQLVLPE